MIALLTSAAAAAAAAGAAPAAAIADNQVNNAMQLDVTTLIAIGSFIVAVGTLIWRSGGEAAARKAFEAYQAKTDAERQKWREDFERSVEQRFGAVNGAATLAREQVAEVREKLAANYMTKSEIAEIERRVNSNTDRVLDHLDKIDTRLNVLTERVMEAIQKNAAAKP